MSDKNRFSDSSAKSYSQALYELATEEKNLNDVEEHAVSIIKLISQSEDFNSLIKDPTNKQEDQLNVIGFLEDKAGCNKYKTCQYIIDNKKPFEGADMKKRYNMSFIVQKIV